MNEIENILFNKEKLLGIDLDEIVKKHAKSNMINGEFTKKSLQKTQESVEKEVTERLTEIGLDFKYIEKIINNILITCD